MNKSLTPLLFFVFFCGVVSAQTDSVVTAQPDSVCRFPDEQASFPGGELEMRRYLAANTKYPAEAREKDQEGIVYVAFIVEVDGRLTNLRIIHGAASSLDSAALAAVRDMPLWIPGKQDGRNVRSQFILPIQFALSQKPYESNQKAQKRKRR